MCVLDRCIVYPLHLVEAAFVVAGIVVAAALALAVVVVAELAVALVSASFASFVDLAVLAFRLEVVVVRLVDLVPQFQTLMRTRTDRPGRLPGRSGLSLY